MTKLLDAVIGFLIDWVAGLVALALVAGGTAAYLLLVAVMPYGLVAIVNAWLSGSPEGEALKVPAAVVGVVGWCVWKDRLDAVFLKRPDEKQ